MMMMEGQEMEWLYETMYCDDGRREKRTKRADRRSLRCAKTLIFWEGSSQITALSSILSTLDLSSAGSLDGNPPRTVGHRFRFNTNANDVLQMRYVMASTLFMFICPFRKVHGRMRYT